MALITESDAREISYAACNAMYRGDLEKAARLSRLLNQGMALAASRGMPDHQLEDRQKAIAKGKNQARREWRIRTRYGRKGRATLTRKAQKCREFLKALESGTAK